MKIIKVGVDYNAIQSILQLIGEDFYEEHLPGRQGSMIEHQYLALGDLEEQRGIDALNISSYLCQFISIYINLYQFSERKKYIHKILVQVKNINIIIKEVR